MNSKKCKNQALNENKVNLNKKKLYKTLFFLFGSVSFVWFLIRVIPKPSRATYPCIQASFPLASAFVIWLSGSIGAIAFFKKMRAAFRSGKYWKVSIFIFAGLFLFTAAVTMSTGKFSFAGNMGSSEVAAIEKNHKNILDELPAKVSVVQSGKQYASEIQYTEILDMVREAVRLAGGLQNIISDGDIVMLKPNVVNHFDFRPVELNGVTTDHRVLQAVVSIVREVNPNGKVIIAEGSADHVPTFTNFEKLRYFEISGVDEFVAFEMSSGEYREYGSKYLHAVSLPDSLSLYPDHLKPNLSREVYYNKKYFEADVLISVPVLKNHTTAGITGGVKNVAMGATPSNIYADRDWSKKYLRSRVIDHNNGNLDKWLHDYYAGRPADFVIMDGLQGLSSGPGGGNNLESNQHNMRLILAGKDAIAVDAIEGLIMGHDPQKANYLVSLHNHDFGIADPALIEVIGVKVHQVRKFFGFDQNTATAQTAFEKSTSSDYQVSGYISGDSLHLSVPNPADLARIQVSLDGQRLAKYIVGGFGNISIPIENATLSQGIVDVYFEDRYLNPLSRQITVTNLTDAELPEICSGLHIFPNPVGSKVNVKLNNAPPGIYQIQIVGMDGKNISSEKIFHSSSDLNWQGNSENLVSGHYVIQMTSPDGNVITNRFVKQ